MAWNAWFALLAYADWHAFGFAESALQVDAVGLENEHAAHDHGHSHDHGDSHGHDHGDSPDDEESSLSVLFDHLREDQFALVAKTAELGAATTLAVHYGREQTK